MSELAAKLCDLVFCHFIYIVASSIFFFFLFSSLSVFLLLLFLLSSLLFLDNEISSMLFYPLLTSELAKDNYGYF